MGRPKGYDRDAVMEKAIELFWRNGYEATSTQQLVDHLGINRNTMYSEFGKKREFFESALKHYEEHWLNKNFGPLEAPDAGVETILGVFEHYASIGNGRRAGMGCLLTNASVELASREASTREIAAGFVERVTLAFENALRGARDAGELAKDVAVTQEAGFLTSTWLGMLVLARSCASPEALEAVPGAIARHLEGLR